MRFAWRRRQGLVVAGALGAIVVAVMLWTTRHRPPVQQAAVPGEIVVRYKATVTNTPGSVQLKDIDPSLDGLRIISRSDVAHYVTIAIPRGTEDATIERLRALAAQPESNIISVGRNYYAQALGSDALLAKEWYLNRISWNRGTERTIDCSAAHAPVVAVVDSGISAHRLLAGTIEPGKAFPAEGKPSNDTRDEVGHGTLVAGIIAARPAGSTSFSGVNRCARVMPIKVFDASGRLSLDQIAKGVDYAADHAKIINISLGCAGGCNNSQQLAASLAIAVTSKHALIVVAAGNDNGAPLGFPATDPHVMAVSATDADDGIATFASHGENVSVAAPGVAIVSTSRDGSFCASEGTSFAAPIVSAIAASLLTGRLTPKQVQTEIEVEAQHVGAEPYVEMPGDQKGHGRNALYGHGRVRVYPLPGLTTTDADAKACAAVDTWCPPNARTGASTAERCLAD